MPVKKKSKFKTDAMVGPGLIHPTYLGDVTLDSTNDTITVEVLIPDGIGGFARREEVMSTEPGVCDFNVAAALEHLATALRDWLSRGGAISEEPKCLTCSGTCCRTFSAVRLTKEDYERIRDHLLKYKLSMLEGKNRTVSDYLRTYATVAWTGYYAEIVYQPFTGYAVDTPNRACPFLSPEGRGCTIYDIRPQACREFSWHNCDHYEEHPDLMSGKVRLPIVK